MNEQSGLVAPPPIDDLRRPRRYYLISSSFIVFSCLVWLLLLLLFVGQQQQRQQSSSPTTTTTATVTTQAHKKWLSKSNSILVVDTDDIDDTTTTTTTTTTNNNNVDDDTIPSAPFFVPNATTSNNNNNNNNNNAPPNTNGQPLERCDWILGLFYEKNSHKTEEELRDTFRIQSTDANMFYRATANIFWRDFVLGGWHGQRLDFATLGIPEWNGDGTPLQPKSTWTWVTGDQHLSNFGAWKNRHGDVVFGVNDFDEAAIYDFQVDILRIATSVVSHGYTNQLAESDIDNAILAFTDTCEYEEEEEEEEEE